MVLEVCGSAVQLVCAPARSLWPTLASAASTLALFGAANWGLELFFLNEGAFIGHLLMHIIFAFSMPLFPILISFVNACNVWTVKRAIQKSPVALTGDAQLVELRSVTILCNCPLFIEVPSSVSLTSEDELLRTRGYKLVLDLKDFCPLELAPRPEAATRAPPAAIGTSDQQLADHAHNQKTYLQFPKSVDRNPDSLKERELLLRLGLAPEYSQLRFLRSRSRFQAVVTALQAGGYVLSVVQRLAQQLAVCPLEALVCFLSIIVMVQLLLELYACSHFQRPLLLRLNHSQFSQFWGGTGEHDHTRSSSLRQISHFAVISVTLLLALPFAALSVYYAVHYMHLCLLCSAAALLFLWALLLFAIGFLMRNYLTKSWEMLGERIFLSSPRFFLGSIVLAVLSTAKDWDLFHSPTNKSVSWILPHVSSQD